MMKIVRIQHTSIEVIQLNTGIPARKKEEQVPKKQQQQFRVVNKKEAQNTLRYNKQKEKQDLTKKVEGKRILPLKKQQELKQTEPSKRTQYPRQKPQESQKIKRRELQAVTENHKVTQAKQLIEDELLHPAWRQFPHTTIFGWTENHQLLLDRLEKLVIAGELQSTYYGNELEYHKGPCSLHPPLVRTAREAFSLIRTGIVPGTLQLKEQQYDADDEESPGQDICTESLWVAEVADSKDDETVKSARKRLQSHSCSVVKPAADNTSSS